MTYRDIRARDEKNKERIYSVNPFVPKQSGIYVLTRTDGEFMYAYIGQSVNILKRLVEHLSGHQQHIDLSLRKHGLYSQDNPFGWDINFYLASAEDLNKLEQEYIKTYANRGYQLRNKTSGSQDTAKRGIAENKPSRGYYDGLAQGYKNAQREIAHLFEKHLDYKVKGDRETPTVNQRKAIERFERFMIGENYGNQENSGDCQRNT